MIAPSKLVTASWGGMNPAFAASAREVLDQLEARSRVGHRDAGTSLPPRPRHQPRDHGAVPEAGLPDLFAEHLAVWMRTCWSGSSAKRSAPA